MRTKLITAIAVAIMFITANCFAQTHHTFALRVNGSDTVVNLPREVPSMVVAKYLAEQCYDASLCVDHCAVNEDETLIVSFWHYRGEIVGFVLHDLSLSVTKHTGWLYADGTPASVTVEEFDAKLTELWESGGMTD